MNQIDQIKAYTEMVLRDKFKGVKSIEFDDRQQVFWVETVGFHSWPLLDPITDLALCMKAVMDYGVNIQADKFRIVVNIWNYEELDDFNVIVNADNIGSDVDMSLLPPAIIECILKSRGKWV